MKSKILFLFMAFLQPIFSCINAQTNSQEGKWELVSANINLLDKGRSELIHTLTAQEIETKAIPVILELGNDSLVITTQKKKTQTDYVLEEGRSAQMIPDSQTQNNYVSWLSEKGQLILVAEYTDSDYNGNELRIIYKKK